MSHTDRQTIVPEHVMQRLLAERSAAYDELRALIQSRGDGPLSYENDLACARIIRRIAVIDAGCRQGPYGPMTEDERAWLRAQGVPVWDTDQARR